MTTDDGPGDGPPAGVAPTAAAIERAETSLETWLVEQAEACVPEVVLKGLLRDYADDIEHLGYAPRSWGRSESNGE